MKIDDLEKVEIRVVLNSPIHYTHIQEKLREKCGDDEIFRADIMEVCRQYVWDNPEILDQFDISIKQC